MSGDSEIVLDGRELTCRFGGLVAVNAVTFQLMQGEILGLIGPNGAGKTTLVSMLSGTTHTTGGQTFLRGQLITGFAPHRISRLGLARTHQVVKPLRGMTVRENAAVGALFAGGKSLRSAQEIAERALESVGLAGKGRMLSSSLSVGDLKRLELARALATDPQVLLLDEVMAGLNSREVEQMMELVQKLNTRGLAVLIVDHVLKAVMGISHRVMVLQLGKKITEGSPREVATDARVLSGYLGEFYGQQPRRQQMSGCEPGERAGISAVSLEATALGSGYGNVQVLWDVDLRISQGEIVALVGSNGAGKTTLLRTLSGLLDAKTGRILLNGQDITNLRAEERTKLGLAHIPEGRRLFAGMTVQDNILVGGFTQSPAQVQRDLDRIWALFPELFARRRRLAGTLSGGEQQMCAIARGLMVNPSILMIDEVSLGLAPLVVTRLVQLLARISRETSIAIMLVEQDIHLAFEIASRGYVLEMGRVALEGRSEELRANPDVKRAYIGL